MTQKEQEEKSLFDKNHTCTCTDFHWQGELPCLVHPTPLAQEEKCQAAKCENLAEFERYSSTLDGFGIKTGMMRLFKVCKEHSVEPPDCGKPKKGEPIVIRPQLLAASEMVKNHFKPPQKEPLPEAPKDCDACQRRERPMTPGEAEIAADLDKLLEEPPRPTWVERFDLLFKPDGNFDKVGKMIAPLLEEYNESVKKFIASEILKAEQATMASGYEAGSKVAKYNSFHNGYEAGEKAVRSQATEQTRLETSQKTRREERLIRADEREYIFGAIVGDWPEKQGPWCYCTGSEKCNADCAVSFNNGLEKARAIIEEIKNRI